MLEFAADQAGHREQQGRARRTTRQHRDVGVVITIRFIADEATVQRKTTNNQEGHGAVASVFCRFVHVDSPQIFLRAASTRKFCRMAA